MLILTLQISEIVKDANKSDNKANCNSSVTSVRQNPLQQQANAIASICQPLVDKVKLWEQVAAAEYAADGDAEGWHPHEAPVESSEDKYMKVCTVLSHALSICDMARVQCWLVNWSYHALSFSVQ